LQVPLASSRQSWPNATEVEVRGATRTGANVARIFIDTALLSSPTVTLITQAQPTGAGCTVLANPRSVLPARAPRISGSTLTYDDQDATRDVLNPREHQSYYRLKEVFTASAAQRFLALIVRAMLSPATAEALLTTAFPDGAVLDAFADLSNVTSEWNTNNNAWTAAGTLSCTTSPCTGVWTTRNHPANTDVWATMSTGTTGQNRVCLRARSIGAATNDGYCYVIREGANDVGMERVDNNIFTLVGARAACGFAAGDQWGGRTIGSSFTGYCFSSGAWAVGNTVSDTTYTGPGQAAFVTVTDGHAFDNFGMTSPRGGSGR